MALSIKNAEVESLARELARRRKISVTEAIRQSLARETEREKIIPRNDNADLVAELMAIAKAAAALPVLSTASEDEILGYDEYGIPTQ
jgi:antitoxin VapB